MVSIVDDLGQCEQLWQAMIPAQGLFDIWELRACFQRSYGYRPCFVLAEDQHGAKGLLPLSWSGKM